MTYQDCPNCSNPLRMSKIGSNLKVWNCLNCRFSSTKNPEEEEEEYEEIPANLRKREKQIAEKIVKTFLPKQKIKIRLVRKLDPDEYGRTEFEKKVGEFWKSPIKHILISELNFKKSPKNPNPKRNFIDTTVHEVPHAEDAVRFSPKFNPRSLKYQFGCDICGEDHQGGGHDELWHGKYLKYKGRIFKAQFIKNYLKDKKKK